jgi:hypothetical protein
VKQAPILERLRAADDQIAREVTLWIEREDAKPLSLAPAEVTVNEAAHVWRVRYNGSSKRGQTLRGAESLLFKLERLTPQKKLEQFAFDSESGHGNIFFEKANGHFVGAILVSH